MGMENRSKATTLFKNQDQFSSAKQVKLSHHPKVLVLFQIIYYSLLFVYNGNIGNLSYAYCIHLRHSR